MMSQYIVLKELNSFMLLNVDEDNDKNRYATMINYKTNRIMWSCKVDDSAPAIDKLRTDVSNQNFYQYLPKSR